MSATISAPVWDMSVVFPSLESPEFVSSFEQLRIDLDQLAANFDAWGIHGGQTESDASSVLEKVIFAWDQFETSAKPIRCYIYSFVSTDANNQIAQARLSEMEPMYALHSKLFQRLTAWVGAQTIQSESKTIEEHTYFLDRCKVMAARQMSPLEEDLAADLRQTGSSAWSRLHGDVTSQITVNVRFPAGVEQHPMAVVRGMAYDTDRGIREAAYHAELETWTQFRVPLAAAMNSIKGEVGMLSTRRGWESPLAHAAFECNIDLATLEAMMSAARDAFPSIRNYLQAKAKLVSGKSSLDWFDLFAPAGGSETEWTYDQGADFVSKQFHKYSPKMGEFADRNFRENWIDALPRTGKRDGAFCMGLRRDESRILMNWKPSFGSVSTLAHELGHGYHNLCLDGKTSLQHDTPMTLAETASIFCEAIISQAAMAIATPSEQINILEQSLQRATQTVVDISSRFLFEQAVFEKRKARSLSPEELCDLMLWAQAETYGDGLSEHRHPYMWAVKPHYYSGGNSFYNFPYMFGLLFSLGLYAQYEQDPEKFKSKYDDLLASTGLADAASLARRFDIDITTPAFWEGSLSTVARDVDSFVSLVG